MAPALPHPPQLDNGHERGGLQSELHRSWHQRTQATVPASSRTNSVKSGTPMNSAAARSSPTVRNGNATSACPGTSNEEEVTRWRAPFSSRIWIVSAASGRAYSPEYSAKRAGSTGTVLSAGGGCSPRNRSSAQSVISNVSNSPLWALVNTDSAKPRSGTMKNVDSWPLVPPG